MRHESGPSALTKGRAALKEIAPQNGRKTQLFHVFTAKKGWPAFSRFVVILCALAFLTVSSAHAMSHFESVNGKSGTEISIVMHADDASHADSHPVSGADNHSCGCSPTAPLSSNFTAATPEGCELIVVEVPSLESRVPSLESPYPIVSI